MPSRLPDNFDPNKPIPFSLVQNFEQRPARSPFIRGVLWGALLDAVALAFLVGLFVGVFVAATNR